MRRPATPRRPAGKGACAPPRDLRIVLATAPPRAAARLSRTLVAGGYAACVSRVDGLHSVYRWRGRMETAKETLLLVKTTARKARSCLAALALAHPYEVPEGLVLTPSLTLRAYAAWVRSATRRGTPSSARA